MIALVFVAIFVAVIAQRITGMGFALVCAPFLVLLLGPFSGIMIVNLCGVASSLLILSRVWRHVDWTSFRRLVIPAMIGIIPGSLLAASLPAAVLGLSVGILLIVALSASLIVARANFTVRGRAAPMIAGFSSGLMNTSAGIGGPAISIYAVLTRWEHRAFAATLQPYFAVVSSFSLVTKLVVAPDAWPILDWWVWAGIAVAFACGLFVGEHLNSHVSHRAAKAAVIAIAFVGAISAVVNGLLQL